MEKRTSRRSVHYGRSNEERQVKSENISKNSSDTNNLIADMAQGFLQAQTNTATVSNRDIISLLEKLNDNLEKLNSGDMKDNPEPPSDEENNISSSNKKSTQQKGPEQSSQSNSKVQGNNDEVLKELTTLVSTMLQGKSTEKDSSSKNQNKDTAKASNIEQQQQDPMAVQTVSQVLAQTQYELANELETSLQKLKEVISKSEKVATNISHLLSKENIKKS